MPMKKRSFPFAVLLPVAAAVIVLLFSFAMTNLQQGQAEKGRQQLEHALRRSAVACYAAEGIYPPDTAYLEEHYGIQIDHERYTVIYHAFASNLMPDITVLENG